MTWHGVFQVHAGPQYFNVEDSQCPTDYPCRMSCCI
jgi:hypothetical protein